jgi:phosphatidyl-myo-inositol dimannoside synthase
MQTANPASVFLPILVLSEHFLPACGGTVTWLFETYSRFAAGEVVVVAGDKGDTAVVDRTLPFKVERIPMRMDDWDPTQPASLRRYWEMFCRVKSSRRRHQSSQIHCMKVLPEGLVAWCLRYVMGVPYVLYAHGEEIQMRLTSRKLAWLIPILYKGAASIIANSAHTKRLLVDIGVRPERIHVIHPGVNVAAFQANEGARENIRLRHNLGRAFVLLTVGRLQRRKGQDMVIRALRLIKKQIPNLIYMIVGTGEEYGYLRELVKSEGVSESVVFVGSIPDEERSAYYSACDVFVMPNRQIDADIEGFGIVFLEAGAAARPVIGGLSGGTAEAIQEGVTGLRVDGDSVQAVAAAVIELLTDLEHARAMGERGRQWVEKAFTWESIVERTRQVTSNVAQGVC